MRFGSVCSGIEAASLAFTPFGWSAAWFSEIEPFCCDFLSHHYPQVPNHGDMAELPQAVRSGSVEAPDLLVGGTPCQAFSIAGDRGSLSDARGNLTLTFCELADAIDDVRVARGDEPCDVFWENVPGVLNTDDNAFGCFLGQLVGAGTPLVPGRQQRWTDAGVVAGPRRVAAWRVLDAQFFGLAQRRRRVFVVASARGGADPAGVLLERKGVRRHPQAGGRTWQDVARRFGARAAGGGGIAGTLRSSDGGIDLDHARASHIVCADVVGSLTASAGPNGHGGSGLATNGGAEAGHLVAHTVAGTLGQRTCDHPSGMKSESDFLVPAVLAFGGNNTAGPIEVATAVRAKGGTGHGDFESETFIAFDPTQITSRFNGSNPKPGDPCHTLSKGMHPPAIAAVAWTGDGVTADPLSANEGSTYTHEGAGNFRLHNCVQSPPTAGVRRLTPLECERLQGVPDNLTRILRNGKPAADGPRYKAIGNSWAVSNVMWIAERLTATRRTQ